MKRKSLTIVILVIIGVIFGVIILDYLNNRPDRRSTNPYALEIESYQKVPDSLITYKEMRNYDLGLLDGSGICHFAGTLYVVGTTSLVTIPLDGSAAGMSEIPAGSVCVAADGAGVYIGFDRHVEVYSPRGADGRLGGTGRADRGHVHCAEGLAGVRGRCRKPAGADLQPGGDSPVAVRGQGGKRRRPWLCGSQCEFRPVGQQLRGIVGGESRGPFR
ncbi:MAG: hypothetical protein R2751_15240 [Bacteroidales bacterium]